MSDQRDSAVGENFSPLSAAGKRYATRVLRLPDMKYLFPERRPSRWSNVYIIGAAKGPVKIGLSADPLRRLQALQTARHERLSILCSLPGDRDRERYLHEFYRGERMAGEWFRRSKRLREFIDEINSGWES